MLLQSVAETLVKVNGIVIKLMYAYLYDPKRYDIKR